MSRDKRRYSTAVRCLLKERISSVGILGDTDIKSMIFERRDISLKISCIPVSKSNGESGISSSLTCLNVGFERRIVARMQSPLGERLARFAN